MIFKYLLRLTGKPSILDMILVSELEFQIQHGTGHMGQFTKMHLEESGISKGNNQLTFHYTENVHNMIYEKNGLQNSIVIEK